MVPELQDNYALVDRESLCNHSTNVSKETYGMFSNLVFISEAEMSPPIWGTKEIVILIFVYPKVT